MPRCQPVPNRRQPRLQTSKRSSKASSTHLRISLRISLQPISLEGGKKTKKGRKERLQDVLLHEGFNVDDLEDMDFDRLDHELASNPGGVTETNGWKISEVPIYIPTGKRRTKASRREAAARQRRDRAAAHDESRNDANSEDEYPAGPKYYAPNLRHRSLVDIVVEACSGPASKDYHRHPFEEHWIPPWNPQEK
jgi:hypothetical protein